MDNPEGGAALNTTALLLHQEGVAEEMGAMSEPRWQLWLGDRVIIVSLPSGWVICSPYHHHHHHHCIPGSNNHHHYHSTLLDAPLWADSTSDFYLRKITVMAEKNKKASEENKHGCCWQQRVWKVPELSLCVCSVFDESIWKLDFYWVVFVASWSLQPVCGTLGQPLPNYGRKIMTNSEQMYKLA